MKLKSFFTVVLFMTCGSLSAQNATKADLDKLANQVNALSQKVSQLELNLERVITENVNLVEQLNVKTVSSIEDKNGITTDIVKIVPDEDNNNVAVTLRFTNNSGIIKSVFMRYYNCYALDSNSNLNNNKYSISGEDNLELKLENGIPVTCTIIINQVPTTCAYLSHLQINYALRVSASDETVLKFKGVHIPW